ncbi:sensor histidine kinase [Azospirillum sp. RWY-5-1]|uniref:histidine kinase n=1 Tax=Azospirillum oleiclasticum TaxID=2735135 RepID=A0ABX2T8L1_9PROT|nr:sensor histidine kinase [Azospirillum oleiclasticum]NYZ12134.1 sensor histidine kinase [Azospirillum oleiclasticum]NYZ19294.1 sensor histidine kinase [Azospirillum oleiclasticum]
MVGVDEAKGREVEGGHVKARASLGARLLVGAAVWITLALALAGNVLDGLFHRHVEAEQARRMGDHLDDLVAALTVVDGRPVLTREPTYPLFHRPYSGLYWQVVPPQGAPLRSRSLWDAALDLPPAPADGEVHAAALPGPDGQRLSVWERSVALADLAAPVRIAVAVDDADVGAAKAAFGRTLTLSLVVLGAGLLAAAAAQVVLGLRPLRGMRRDLAAVRTGRAERLGGRYPAEVQPLADDLNTVLDGKAVLLERARTQAGNLAHALKTPLSVLANEADALAARDPERADRLAREVARMRRQVEIHLARARAAATAGSLGEATAVRPVADALARTLGRLHAGRGVVLAVDGAPALFRGEVQDLQEMLGNVMDNACKWAASRVAVTVMAPAGARFAVHVDDDGPGLPPDRRDDVLGRGVRLDERVDGSGLGLAIVQELAGLYGGGVALAESPMGGLRVTLTLPAGG